MSSKRVYVTKERGFKENLMLNNIWCPTIYYVIRNILLVKHICLNGQWENVRVYRGIVLVCVYTTSMASSAYLCVYTTCTRVPHICVSTPLICVYTTSMASSAYLWVYTTCTRVPHVCVSTARIRVYTTSIRVYPSAHVYSIYTCLLYIHMSMLPPHVYSIYTCLLDLYTSTLHSHVYPTSTCIP